jgi:adenine-specific DNA-methyltransferase
LPHGDVLFIQPYNEEDIFFLLGYLNSNLFREYYLSKGPRRGGRVVFTQKILENCEIPRFQTAKTPNLL